MIRMFNTLGILLLVLAFSQGALADDPCDGLHISVSTNPVSLNTYNDTALTITVSRSDNEDDCPFMISVESAVYTTRNISGSAGSIPLGLHMASGHQSSSLIRNYNSGTSTSQFITGTITDHHSSTTKTYYPYIDTSASIAAGTYSGTYTFRVYWLPGTNGGSLSSAHQRDDESVTFNYTKSASVSLSLVDSGPGSAYNANDFLQTLDFGTLTLNETLGFDLWLMYSSGYSLKVTSANLSNLKHATRPDLVPYTMTIDGLAASLTGSGYTKTGSGSSGASGKKLPVVVKIGTIGNVVAGTYSDTVTFKISAP